MADTSSDTAATAPARQMLPAPMPPHPDAERYVGTMQRDGRLLLRFISRRSDRFLGAERAADTPARGGGSADVLFIPPEQVMAGNRLPDLASYVDELSWRAAPTNVRSIRLTSAYLGVAIEDGEPPPDISQEARSVRKCMWFVATLAVATLVVAIALLAHMEVGRRLLLQLKDLRQQEQDVLKDVSTLALAESLPQGVVQRPGPGEGVLTAVWLTDKVAGQMGWTPDRLALLEAAAPLCAKPLFLGAPGNAGRADKLVFATDVPAADAGAFTPSLWRDPVTQKASAICRRFDDTKVRLALIYSGLADWNCRSFQIFSLVSMPYEVLHRMSDRVLGHRATGEQDSCGEPTVPLPPEVTVTAWRSHETNVTTISSVVAGFLLPLILGCLGGCAYALRRIDNKLSNWTLEPHDGRHAVARVALAAVLGGLVGVVWTSGDPVTLGGFTLSLAAAAFFIGFSVEGVFKVIESLINNVTGTIGAGAAATPMPRPAAPRPPAPGPGAAS